LLCQPRGNGRDLRVGGEGLRAGGGRDRQPDRGRIGRGGLIKIGGRGPPFPDAELLRALAALLTETGLTEIEYAIGDRRVRVSRVAAGPPASVPGVVSAPSVAAGSIEHPGMVKAPMVGTAYLAPQPGAPPFVHLGDVVTEGQPLLI